MLVENAKIDIFLFHGDFKSAEMLSNRRLPGSWFLGHGSGFMVQRRALVSEPGFLHVSYSLVED